MTLTENVMHIKANNYIIRACFLIQKIKEMHSNVCLYCFLDENDNFEYNGYITLNVLCVMLNVMFLGLKIISSLNVNNWKYLERFVRHINVNNGYGFSSVSFLWATSIDAYMYMHENKSFLNFQIFQKKHK